MLNGPMAMGILSYAVQILLTSILQLLFNAADLVVVGRFCGSVSVAAVGATGAITNLVINLFIGLSVGAGVCVAHAIGSRREELIHRTIHTSIPTAILSGLFLTVVGVLFSWNILRWMGTPETVLPLAALYMEIYFGGMTFNMVYNFAASILRAAGDTGSPLKILTVAGVVNVILNIVFVTVFHMNVAGVALATTISQALSALWAVGVLMNRKDACRLSLKKMHIYAPELKKILRIGLPAGIQGAMFNLSNVIIQSSINSFGQVIMSGNAAVSNLEGFVYASVNAFSQTAVNYVGQNCGACRYDRVKRVILLCLGYVTVSGTIFGVGFYLLAKPLLSLYITDSPEAIVVGIIRMSYTCLPYFIYGIMDVITGALRGLGASFVTMMITVLGICGSRILWIFTVFQMEPFHKPEMLYISWPISWVVTLIAQIIAIVLIYNREKNRYGRGKTTG